MKHNLIRTALIAVFCLAVGYTVYTAQNKNDHLSDVMLENVEALAYVENDMCPNGCVSDGEYCYCNGYYEDYGDYNW